MPRAGEGFAKDTRVCGLALGAGVQGQPLEDVLGF